MQKAYFLNQSCLMGDFSFYMRLPHLLAETLVGERYKSVRQFFPQLLFAQRKASRSTMKQ